MATTGLMMASHYPKKTSWATTPKEARKARKTLSPLASTTTLEKRSKEAMTDHVEEYFAYLDALRESGVTNMFGARPYLAEEFGLREDFAERVLTQWMRSFDRDKSPAERAKAWKMERPIDFERYPRPQRVAFFQFLDDEYERTNIIDPRPLAVRLAEEFGLTAEDARFITDRWGEVLSAASAKGNVTWAEEYARHEGRNGNDYEEAQTRAIFTNRQ